MKAVVAGSFGGRRKQQPATAAGPWRIPLQEAAFVLKEF
jgi:hypothetical protein